MTEIFHSFIDREIVRVDGADAAQFLQGQLSQDIDALAPGDSAPTFVLQPNGRTESWFRVHRIGPDTFVFDAEVDHAAALVSRLQRFLIRTDAAIEASGTMAMLRVRSATAIDGRDQLDVSDGILVADVDWIGFKGFDILGSPEQLAQLAAGSPNVVGTEIDLAAMEALRIRAGVPRFGIDFMSGSVPAEAGRAVLDVSVSFTKGCYTGQELVARMNSRGSKAPRRLRLLMGKATLELGSDVMVGGETVGEVTSVAGSWALSTVMRKIEPGTTAEVGDVGAEVVIVPGDDLS